jgi:hypothetical protein
VADETRAGERLGEEPGGREEAVDERETSLERLLHGADGEFRETVEVDMLTFSELRRDERNAVDAQFGSLFHEPLDAVGILGGSDGEMEIVRARMRIGEPFDDVGETIGLAYRDEAGAAERAGAVGEEQLVADRETEGTETVTSLVAREFHFVVVDIRGKKQLHYNNVYKPRCKGTTFLWNSVLIFFIWLIDRRLTGNKQVLLISFILQLKGLLYFCSTFYEAKSDISS